MYAFCLQSRILGSTVLIRREGRQVTRKIEPSSGWILEEREDGSLEGEQDPITLCERCKAQYTEDLNRDAFGDKLLADVMPLGPIENLCDACKDKKHYEELSAQTLAIIQEKLGLNEVTTLRSIRFLDSWKIPIS